MPKTIRLSDYCIEELSKLGKFGDSYDDIIKRLIHYWYQSKTNLPEPDYDESIRVGILDESKHLSKINNK